MRNDRLNIINDILCGYPVRMRDVYFRNNHPTVLGDIENFCSGIDVPFKQMLWHWVNDIPSNYLCVCGNKTTFNRNWMDGYRISCSPKCAQSSDDTKKKRRETTIKRYGVDNVSKLDIIKDKQAKTNIERYGSTSSFQNEYVKRKYKETCLEKYGVDHYFKTDSFKSKSILTNNKKYGVDHYVQSNQYVEKSMITNNEKYGVDWYSKSGEYTKKTRDTNLRKYGFDYYSQTPEYKIQVSETNMDKYGSEWYFQSDEFQESISDIMIEKYGYPHYTKTPEYKNRVKRTNLDKYGSEWYFQSDEFRNSIGDIMNEKYGATYYAQTSDYSDMMSSDEYVERRLLKRVGFYKDMGFQFISTSDRVGFVDLYNNVCGHTFSIHPTTLKRRLDVNLDGCVICNPLDTGSGQEDRLCEWIDSLGIDYVANTRSVIDGFELDIYIESLNLAIEYNGLYWHSDLYKYKNYHLDKTNKCADIGVRLLHIWEDDWLYNEEVVKSIIKNSMNLSDGRIYARKCDIREVSDKKSVDVFFNANHIQGTTRYKTAIGLFHKDVMVSCMLLHKPRVSDELVRFCSKINTTVVGSASRLFKYYIKHYDVDEIISFADSSLFSGDLYKNLGFELVYRTDPNYWWVVDGIRKHRFNYSKKKLVKGGFDQSKTEVEIMHDRGYYRVYGCGLDKWVWNR